MSGSIRPMPAASVEIQDGVCGDSDSYLDEVCVHRVRRRSALPGRRPSSLGPLGGPPSESRGRWERWTHVISAEPIFAYSPADWRAGLPRLLAQRTRWHGRGGAKACSL